MNFFDDRFHFLDLFAERLDHFSHFLDDWFVDLVAEKVWRLFGSGGLVLRSVTGSVDLLDGQRAGRGLEDEMYGLFIWLNFDDLRNWCLIC
jgi:hypothetical protein